jgi:uncharacterized protein (TIGR03435 family)
MRNWLIPALAVFVAQPLFSRDDDARPRFEVVSIKQCVGTEPRSILSFSPRSLRWPCVGLLRLIQEAYQIYGDGKADFLNRPPALMPIEGFPDQMSSGRYTIDTRADSPQSMAMMRGPMMQRLLEDRFHLKIHREIREVPVYIMTVAKDGPKLQATKEDSCRHAEPADFIPPNVFPRGKPPCGFVTPPTKTGTHYISDQSGITIATFSKTFKIFGLPVIDRTGLSGTYDIHLEWESSPPDTATAESGVTDDPSDMAMVSSIRKQLGLQLNRGRGPYEFFVIDHLERPSEN